MGIKVGNIYARCFGQAGAPECFESLHRANGMLIQRIVSKKDLHPQAEWFDQEDDEWVVLLKGEASLEFELEGIVHLKEGDYLFIPAHKKHRVYGTYAEGECTWLAVHGRLT
jgi:cupin 2 domain-containing protein